MGRVKDGRRNGAGTLEQRGDIWLARWTRDGKRYTRSTGCKVSGGKKSRQQAEELLAEFTADYRLGDEERILERQVARLGGVKKEIEAEEAKKPALRLMDGWTAYRQSQSRPRSGDGTMRNYELQYFQFVTWVSEHHPDVEELRQVSREIADEYAQFLLAGTPKTERDAITAARKWLYHYDYHQRKDGAKEQPEEIQRAIDQRRELAKHEIRDPVRGTTFNRHLNALALIWRHVGKNNKARLSENPWTFNEETGEGIRRIVLTHAERPHRRRDLTPGEIMALLQKAQGELRVLIAVGLYLGLRLGDAVLLRWQDFDRVNGIATVRSRKTDTLTTSAIHPALARIIEDETNAQTGYLMPKTAKQYLSGKSGRVALSNKLSALFKSVGIETQFREDGKRARSDCGFHSLRHTFVTMIRKGGAGLHAAQMLAGHRTARMTEHYTHDSVDAVLALPDMTGDAPAKKPKPRQPQASTMSLDDLKAALATLPAEERAALLTGCCDK